MAERSAVDRPATGRLVARRPAAGRSAAERSAVGQFLAERSTAGLVTFSCEKSVFRKYSSSSSI